MWQEFINFLLYNETNEIVQKNVQVLAQIASLYILYIIYYMFFAEKTSFPTYDGALLCVIFLTWYGIKKHGIYYTHVLFLILVPLFNYALFDTISRHGLVGVLWSFPVILGLYFCFYKSVAVVAVSITFIITMITCISVMSLSNFFSSFVTLLMVIICFTTILFNFYHLYDLVKNQAKIDPLTKMLNRNSLDDYLVISIKQQIKSLPPILLYFDLDNFKYINDTFGHSVGDLALINLSKLLKKQISNKNLVFRLGGEEFLVLLNDVSIVDAQSLAEDIRSKIEQSNLIENGHVVTSSIGMAVYQGEENWDLWLKRADEAMYQAKQNGKNQVIFIG